VRLGQGRENTKEYLKANPDLMDEIELAVRQQALSGNIPIPMPSAGDDDEGGGLEDGEL
jgi:recombination protein RecA